MPAPPDDWRLTRQKEYLRGAVLRWSKWTPRNPENDHDHCEFCWAKFMEDDLPEILRFGYTTTDRYRWICQQCFEDFKDRFEWEVMKLP